MRLASALSVRIETLSAAKEASERARVKLGSTAPDLALVFVTAPHVPRAAHAAELVASVTGARHAALVSGKGVIAGAIEVEDAPGVSVLLASLPGVRVAPFRAEDLPKVPDKPSDAWVSGTLAPAMHADAPDHAGTLLFCDPFSTPLVRLLPAMSAAGRSAPIVGGMASAGAQPGGNALGLAGDVRGSGGIGISLSGRIHLEAVVSQGCRPVGPTMVVTKARDNVILELGGRRAVDTLRRVAEDLTHAQRTTLAQGMLLGKVINEYRDRFGQGDFLIRRVHGIDPSTGSIVAGDFFRVGQTVQIHVRDAETAQADLAMLLDAQRLRPSPEGGLVFTCVSRGKTFFGEPHRDADAITRAFGPAEAGEQQAKSGRRLDVGRESLALAGFFADGEFGPIGSASYLHTMTTSLALVRSDRPVD